MKDISGFDAGNRCAANGENAFLTLQRRCFTLGVASTFVSDTGKYF